jgi:hypothetical protein
MFAQVGRDDTAAIERAAERKRMPLTVLRIAEPEAAFPLTSRFVLVRPDQHIAWQGPPWTLPMKSSIAPAALRKAVPPFPISVGLRNLIRFRIIPLADLPPTIRKLILSLSLSGILAEQTQRAKSLGINDEI